MCGRTGSSFASGTHRPAGADNQNSILTSLRIPTNVMSSSNLLCEQRNDHYELRYASSSFELPAVANSRHLGCRSC